MNKILLTVLLATLLTQQDQRCLAYSSNYDEIFEIDDLEVSSENYLTRASKIIVSSSWYLDNSTCLFSLSFLTNSTGSGSAILEKKVNSQWVESGSVNFNFKNSRTLDGVVSVSNLTSGSYRLIIDLEVSGVNETKTLETKIIS